MNLFVPLIAPLLLWFPTKDGATASRNPRLTAEPTRVQDSGRNAASEWLEAALPAIAPVAHQVRIEQRVILRISPRPGAGRQNLVGAMPAARSASRIVERPYGECVAVGNIAAVQAQRGSRLLLYLRDRRLIAADLEKACSAQNYYSGFYFEQNADQRLCVGRDRLQARNGAKCSLSSLHQLVAVADD